MDKKRNFKNFNEVLEYILKNKPWTIGIDGNSGAGKTTLAKNLAERINGFVLPLDLFHKRERKEWDLDTDINDFEDFEKINAVIKRIKRGKKFELHNVYNHADGTFTRSFMVEPKEFLIIEGLLTMELDLDFKIFLNIDPEVALVRGKERDIKERNLTEKQWVIKKYLFHDEYSKLIPKLKEKADVIIDTTKSFPVL